VCSLYSPRGAKVVFQEVEDGFIAFVDEIPGANTQGATLDEARENLQEAVELVLAGNRELARESIGSAKFSRERLKIAG
jgi:predicted RNase H-like HicB family nuclease